MRILVLALSCATMLLGTLLVQAQEAPVRLALISREAALQPAADLLTVALSGKEHLTLLERSEIEKVYREQGLAAGNQDYLKLGRLLSADGLVLLETGKGATNDWLSVQLVAVKPGVLLSSDRFAWPISNIGQWAEGISTHLTPLLPKLGVMAKDAIPISVVNLRSAIQSSESRETEWQLTLLAIERLSREKRLFVLERRRMQLMAAEQDLNGLDDSAFWDGSYLLDGVIDRDGFAHDTMTVSARLVPPGSNVPLGIETSGARTNFAEVINQLAIEVLTTLSLDGSHEAWDPAAEAGQFNAEAQWAFKWGLYPQAQTAAESAWALGRRNPETADLLVRAYVESMPDRSVNGGDGMHVLQVPDATAFPKLARGLEFVLQNSQVFFGGSNSLATFTLGMRLLRQAFNQLESYYYAAELRPQYQDDLRSLRSQARRMIEMLDAQGTSLTNVVKWNDPRVTYEALKWREAGVAFERPEDSLEYYRDLLFAGAKVVSLPRIIGWTWPDRRRVPALMRQLAEGTRASANTTVRLEGLFLALLLAPDDEEGNLRGAEEELESALWENRALLFRDVDCAKLVERTRSTLAKKMGYQDIYHAFAHEPFASFKHRLRLGYLSQTNAINAIVLEEFFPNTNAKMETPQQARELLPLMEALLSDPVLSKRSGHKLSALRQSAGAIEKPTTPAANPEKVNVIEAKFVPWKFASNRSNSHRTPNFDGMIFRNGNLWVRVQHLDQQMGEYGDHSSTSYLSIDPQRGVTAEIPPPVEHPKPGRLFEISKDSLFVDAGGFLYEYSFQKLTWTKIPVPMEGASSLAWLNGRLFVGRSDGLLAVDPKSADVKLLVSSRRTPPANEIDPLWSRDIKVFPLADGKLGALAEGDFLKFDPAAESWSILPLPLKGTPTVFNMTADYFSPAGVQRLLTGPNSRRYIVGFWQEGPAETLLMEETGFGTRPPPAEKLLPPLRWDWPKNYPMEYSQILVEGKTLWALAPRGTGMTSGNPEPVKFSDARDATLFSFTPDARTPLSAAVRFPTNGLPRVPFMNGRPTDILEPHNFGFMMIFERFQQRAGNMAFWIRVPGGFVLGGPKYAGHWFISDAALEEAFADQQKTRRSSSAHQPTP